jgi:hypothetical protein
MGYMHIGRMLFYSCLYTNNNYLTFNDGLFVRLTFLFTSKITFSCHLCRNRSNGSKNNGLGLIILNNGLDRALSTDKS